MKSFLTLLFIISLLSLQLNAQTTILRVDIDNTNPLGTPDGSAWGNLAFPDLQSALNISNTNPGPYEIWVAEGTYNPTEENTSTGQTGDRNKAFFINKDVQLFGGFDGTETGLMQRDIVQHVTILSGEIGNPGIADNTYHVIYILGLSSNSNISRDCIIDGFTIEDGNADGPFPNNLGGGIANIGRFSGNESSPTIQNCVIQNNTANNGRGIYNIGDNGGKINPLINNCTFYNQDAGEATAIINNGNGSDTTSSAVITNCSFYGNAGAFVVIGNYNTADAKIENCIIWGNGTMSPISDFNTVTTITTSIIEGGQFGAIDKDPYFVDAANGDLRLQSHSPAIEKGDNGAMGLSGVITDLDGNPRLSAPCGTIKQVDIGAYERQFLSNEGYENINALHLTQTHNEHFNTSYSIESDQIIDGGMGNTIQVDYEAGITSGKFILLMPGFEVKSDMIFHAYMAGCN